MSTVLRFVRPDHTALQTYKQTDCVYRVCVCMHFASAHRGSVSHIDVYVRSLLRWMESICHPIIRYRMHLNVYIAYADRKIDGWRFQRIEFSQRFHPLFVMVWESHFGHSGTFLRQYLAATTDSYVLYTLFIYK